MHLITNAIDNEGKIIGIMVNGQIGQVNLGENGECSFDVLSQTKYESRFCGKHYLIRN